MNTRKRLSAAEPPHPEDLPVDVVFPQGAPAYLRYIDHLRRQKMVMLISHGLQCHSNILCLEWTKVADEISLPPALGSHVTCISIVNGVLYQAAGRLSGLISDPPLLLHIAMVNPCHGMNLRRHLRFSAQGMVCLWRPEKDEEPHDYVPTELDISIGGFGAAIKGYSCQVGESAKFTLSFIPIQWPGSQLDFTYLTLTGTVIIRRCAPHVATGFTSIGCQFDEISNEEHRQLKLLLSIHGAALRFDNQSPTAAISRV